MKALNGGALGDVHQLEDLKLYVEPGDFGGEGWWSDLGSEVKSVAKRAQQNPLVRAAEKKAVNYGAKALRVRHRGVREPPLQRGAGPVRCGEGPPRARPSGEAGPSGLDPESRRAAKKSAGYSK